jgi:hypothetical protein
MKKRKGLSAWLVTWEWCGDHAAVSDKVAEILDPRMPSERVRQIVELLYHREASLSEKVAWRLLKRNQPYSADFVDIEGVKWEGQVMCGHNPWLLARLVDDLKIETDVQGRDSATWRDRRTVLEMREKLARIKSRSPHSRTSHLN